MHHAGDGDESCEFELAGVCSAIYVSHDIRSAKVIW